MEQEYELIVFESGYHQPIYGGNAFVAMINSEDISEINSKLPYARRGYLLLETAVLLLKVFFWKQKYYVFKGDEYYHHDHHLFVGPEAERIFGNIQASFYPSDDGDKIPMASAVQLGLAKGDLSTFGVLDSTDRKFDRFKLKMRYLKKILALNIFTQQDLDANPNLSIVSSALNDSKVKNALLDEHDIVRKYVMEKKSSYMKEKALRMMKPKQQTPVQPIEIRLPPDFILPEGVVPPKSSSIILLPRSPRYPNRFVSSQSPSSPPTQIVTPIVSPIVSPNPSSQPIVAPAKIVMSTTSSPVQSQLLITTPKTVMPVSPLNPMASPVKLSASSNQASLPSLPVTPLNSSMRFTPSSLPVIPGTQVQLPLSQAQYIPKTLSLSPVV